MDFLKQLAGLQKRVEKTLETLLIPTSLLEQAMHYAVLNGGKRLRAALVYLTGEALDLPLESLDTAAAAVECLHAYSLVHDDLPAMDNDDWRRGKPTCHRAYDEATAILAGDALQTFAFELLSKQPTLCAETKLQQILCLAEAAGAKGLVGGQSLDLALIGRRDHTSEAALKQLHSLKTGVLLKCCIQLALLASKTPLHPWSHTLCTFGEKIGLAFQVQDDILDLTATTNTLGKTAGKDGLQEKPTFVTVLGLQAAQEIAKTLHEEAVECLLPLGKKASALKALSSYMIERAY